jgi:hypothetical protein
VQEEEEEEEAGLVGKLGEPRRCFFSTGFHFVSGFLGVPWSWDMCGTGGARGPEHVNRNDFLGDRLEIIELK